MLTDSNPVLEMLPGPPLRKLVWRGRAVGEASGACAGAAGFAGGRWLLVCFTLSHPPRATQRPFAATALLRLLEPGHALREPAAERRLVELIEAHTLRLDWPQSLLAAPSPQGLPVALAFDHAPTAFAAIAKASGHLWLRGRAPRLGALRSPRCVAPGPNAVPLAVWAQALWFPGGLPPNLLQQALDGARQRQAAARPQGGAR